jgi:hypothetical protein
LLDIRVIALGAVAVIPITGWVLLGYLWGLLDVDWRRCRHGDHSGRIGVIGAAVIAQAIT